MSIWDLLGIDWVVILIATITFIYVYFSWTFDYWSKKKVPSIKPKLFFGNYKDVIMVKKTVGDIMEEFYKQMKDYPFVGFWRFRTPGLLIRDPEMVKHILAKDFYSFGENAFRIDPHLDPLVSRNPFFLRDTPWKNTRSILTPSFTSSKMKLMFPLMEEVAKDLVEFLAKNAASFRPDGIEGKDLASRYTMDMVATCAFGIKANSFKDAVPELRNMTQRVLKPSFKKNIEFLLMNFIPPLSSILKIRIMPSDVDKFFRKIVGDVVEHRNKNNITRGDYLQQLIALKNKAVEDAQAPKYTDEDIAAHAVTFLTDGFETSSIVLSFVMYELSKNPEAQDILRREIDEALKQNNGEFSFDLVAGLPYLEQVINETMRLHPPLMQMEKFCTKACTLTASDGRTCSVDKDTLIIIPVRALQYDPKYFPDPERFDPDRFSPERRESIHKYCFLPFGEGPRMCLGMRFAQAQIKLALSYLVRNFELKTTPKTPKKVIQDPTYFLRCPKGGVWIDFVKREIPT